MKYSKHLFVFVALFGLFFFGCQGTEQINSPLDDQMSKGVSWGDPTSLGDLDNGAIEVELIAGQFYKVGMVIVEKYMGGLKITYNVTVAGGYMTEVHVDLAATADANATTGFHVNKQFSPQFGHFDRNIGVSNENSVEVVFTFEQLKAALGVANLDNNTKFYIAAHSVVCYPVGGGSVSGTACADFPSSGMLTALPRDANFTLDESPYPFEIAGVEYDGYCADPTLQAIAPGVTAEFNFYCTGDPQLTLPACFTPTFYKGYSQAVILKALNYFVNLDLPPYSGAGTIGGVNNFYQFATVINGHTYYIGKKDAQMIVWVLLYNIDGSTFNGGIGGANNTSYFGAVGDNIVDDIVTASTTYEIPCDGGYFAYLAFESAESCASQPFLFRLPAECTEMQCETAMGFRANYNENLNKWLAVDGLSSLFPGSQWFRYFAVTW